MVGLIPIADALFENRTIPTATRFCLVGNGQLKIMHGQLGIRQQIAILGFATVILLQRGLF